MNIFCYVRYLNIDDKHIIYVSVHFYKSLKHLKTNYYKEKNSLQQTVKMLNPINLGEYNISRKEFNNICKKNFNNYNQNGIFTFTFSEFNSDLIIQTLNELKFKLTLLLPLYYISNITHEINFIKQIKDSIFIELV